MFEKVLNPNECNMPKLPAPATSKNGFNKIVFTGAPVNRGNSNDVSVQIAKYAWLLWLFRGFESPISDIIDGYFLLRICPI